MNEIVVNVYGENTIVEAGTTLLELSKQYQDHERYDIVLAFVDGKLCELFKTIDKSCTVDFVTTNSVIGNATYKRSTIFLMIKAFNDVFGKENVKKIKVMYSISKGYYCEAEGNNIVISQANMNLVKQRMMELVDANLPIEKETLNTDKVIDMFMEQGMEDKAKLFKYRRVSKANIYSVGDYKDYYYGYMVASTGYLRFFDTCKIC